MRHGFALVCFRLRPQALAFFLEASPLDGALLEDFDSTCHRTDFVFAIRTWNFDHQIAFRQTAHRVCHLTQRMCDAALNDHKACGAKEEYKNENATLNHQCVLSFPILTFSVFLGQPHGRVSNSGQSVKCFDAGCIHGVVRNRCGNAVGEFLESSLPNAFIIVLEHLCIGRLYGSLQFSRHTATRDKLFNNRPIDESPAAQISDFTVKCRRQRLLGASFGQRRATKADTVAGEPGGLLHRHKLRDLHVTHAHFGRQCDRHLFKAIDNVRGDRIKFLSNASRPFGKRHLQSSIRALLHGCQSFKATWKAGEDFRLSVGAVDLCAKPQNIGDSRIYFGARRIQRCEIAIRSRCLGLEPDPRRAALDTIVLERYEDGLSGLCNSNHPLALSQLVDVIVYWNCQCGDCNYDHRSEKKFQNGTYGKRSNRTHYWPPPQNSRHGTAGIISRKKNYFEEMNNYLLCTEWICFIWLGAMGNMKNNSANLARYREGTF
ncbi:protein of unknown function [Candidatus Filomicrobium marinum]|uniref:Uncharacterized protein n=1 Tax=Candidatus Filomicrobium marinum TaxID=1608628 RepID=A0A0D6JGR5_9HYPH|nr:protein of unknown function [Candidatus Filomicrobium marinum]